MEPTTNQDLLSKAVVSLEKKLQERNQQLSVVQKERDGLRQEGERLLRERLELEQAAADASRLRQEGEGRDSELRGLQRQAEDLKASCSRLEARVAELETCNSHLTAQLYQWKADREAAEVGCIRAQSAQQVQQAELQQLEAANETLRLDLREHSAKLQHAYEREAQLLEEIGQLKESQHKRAADAVPEGKAAPPEQPPSSHAQKLDSLHRDLFLAAAQHMLKDFSANVVQAEQKVACLGRRLEQAQSKFGHVAAHSQSLQEQLEQATGQCRREEQAVHALLASNMRLHENMLQLMEQAATAAGSASAQAKEPPRNRQYQKATQASLGKKQLQQQQQRLLGRDSLSRAEVAPLPALPAPRQPECGGSEQCPSQPAAIPWQAARQQPCTNTASGCSVRAARGLASGRQGMAVEEAVDIRLGGSGPPACVQPIDAARTAAVDATLAISTEYKELHEYYKAVVAEVRRVGSCLAVACGQAKVQQLTQQHAELQRELWDVTEQLEVKVSQLTALKHAGLL